MRVLAIWAHPDDEFCVSGTIRRFVDEGHEAFICWLGSGRKAQTFGEQTEQEKVKERVLKLLGAEEVVGSGLPVEDNEFEKITLLTVVRGIESAIDAVRPEVVISHVGKCLNIDHQIVARAVRTAVARRPEVKEVYACEVLSSTEWAKEAFNPTYFVDITHYMGTKLALLAAYETEKRNFPHPRSEEGIKALAKYRGMQCGCEAAEAFEVVRMVR